MSIVLSGTRTLVLSGTGSSSYQEPESPANPRKSWLSRPLNNANKESFGFLLTAARLCKTGAGSPARPLGSAADEPPLTCVTLTWLGGEAEDWLRFGKPLGARIVDRRTRIECFGPGQVFALVRWASNDYGTIRSTIHIVRAVDRGERYTTMPLVDPGGDILLFVRGWSRVRQAFALIDRIEKAGIDPGEVAPDHWRHMHNRLAAGMQPRTYEAARHRAWLQRRGLRS